MTLSPHILLINPWIHDFAAYDFWAKPLGLLILAGILRQHGFKISYIDCLDRFHPNAASVAMHARNGRGPYLKTKIPNPDGLEDIQRTYSRYGIPPEWFCEDLKALARPDLILVTSLMTYWYPGVQETIKTIKKVFPNIPVVLGGIYATLCHDHAVLHSGADQVIAGPGIESILDLAAAYTGYSPLPAYDPGNLDTVAFPALDLQHEINYAPLLTSRGCPFSCTYCASNILDPKRMQRSPASVVKEILHWHKNYNVIDFAFYDDALLINAGTHIIPILENLIRIGLKVRFHTPNAVHIREITQQTAGLMFAAGFKTIRMGLETTAFDKRNDLDNKVSAHEFNRAITCLKQAGFSQNQIGAYLLIGLPDQDPAAIEASIKVVKQAGITPVLAHYSPIPHTQLWRHAVASSRYDLESDPIFTNNALFPCHRETFSWKALTRLKQLTEKTKLNNK
ncbi:MAG: B12-binding domain-containing radical SAM protein [Desulfobacteraceae bacterium 4572_123]|nr:MAG: B12-binding domain-containing radical SAM protein [Desulfobacteraceae bacterium 4572_123]